MHQNSVFNVCPGIACELLRVSNSDVFEFSSRLSIALPKKSLNKNGPMLLRVVFLEQNKCSYFEV